jgi:hypothetical protein
MADFQGSLQNQLFYEFLSDCKDSIEYYYNFDNYISLRKRVQLNRKYKNENVCNFTYLGAKRFCDWLNAGKCKTLKYSKVKYGGTFRLLSVFEIKELYKNNKILGINVCKYDSPGDINNKTVLMIGTSYLGKKSGIDF